MIRAVAVLARAARPGRAPAGIDADAWAGALLEDVCELAGSLLDVRLTLACVPADYAAVASDRVWPLTTIIGLDPPPADDAARVAGLRWPESSVFAALAGAGADVGVVVCDDAPDLPPLLLAKAFRGLGSAEVAVCPADGGGLVALGARLPVPAWLPRTGLDDGDALARLRAAASGRRALAVGPGWRRLRRPGDVAGLDRGLGGWEATRRLLSS